MNETILKSLIHLFAIISNLKYEVKQVVERNYVESYLIRQFSKKVAEKYLKIFDDQFAYYKRKTRDFSSDDIIKYNSLVMGITKEINIELPLKERIMLIINLLEFNKYSESYTLESP